MKLINHPTFSKEQNEFYLKFLEELNKARTDFLGVSEKLMYYFQNFDLIQNRIDQINDTELKDYLSRTKEDFKEASDFFADLYKKKIN